MNLDSVRLVVEMTNSSFSLLKTSSSDSMISAANLISDIIKREKTLLINSSVWHLVSAEVL